MFRVWCLQYQIHTFSLSDTLSKIHVNIKYKTTIRPLLWCLETLCSACVIVLFKITLITDSEISTNQLNAPKYWWFITIKPLPAFSELWLNTKFRPVCVPWWKQASSSILLFKPWKRTPRAFWIIPDKDCGLFLGWKRFDITWETLRLEECWMYLTALKHKALEKLN